MLKKRFLLLTNIITIIALLCACQQVPQNVKDRNEELESKIEAESVNTVVEKNKSDSSNSNEEIPRGSLDYIREHLNEDASKKYGTITVKYASAGKAKSMPTYEISHGGNDKFDLNSLITFFYNDKYNLNDKDLFVSIPQDKTKTEPTKAKEGWGVDYRAPESTFFDVYAFSPNKDDTTQSLVSYSNGSCWGSPKGAASVGNDYYAITNCRSQNHYYPEYEDISNISYKMINGEKWDLKEAVELVEMFWNKQLASADKEKYNYKVWRVDIIPLSNNNYGYLFMLKFYDESGNSYDCDTYNYWNLEKQKTYEKKRFFDTNNQFAFCLEKGSITRFGKGASFNKVKKIDDNSSFITLAGAMKILEEKMAKYINLNFDTAELCYIKTCDKYPYKDYDGIVEYSETFCQATCTMHIRPYWCFRKDNNYLNCWNTGENYYVDAVTGEIHIIKSDS